MPREKVQGGRGEGGAHKVVDLLAGLLVVKRTPSSARMMPLPVHLRTAPHRLVFSLLHIAHVPQKACAQAVPTVSTCHVCPVCVGAPHSQAALAMYQPPQGSGTAERLAWYICRRESPQHEVNRDHTQGYSTTSMCQQQCLSGEQVPWRSA